MKKCISSVEKLAGALARIRHSFFPIAGGIILAGALTGAMPGIANGQTKPSGALLSAAYPPAFVDQPFIDNAVQVFMVRNNVPGISLAITRDEKLVYVKSYGFADRENRILLKPENLFRIASISKPVTSIAIMKLVEEKKLSLDSKVFGPKGILKNKYGRSPYKEGITDITVRQLLQHVSGGWANDRTDPMFTDPARGIDELIAFTLDTYSLEHTPGTHYAYSNFGYCVLGRVLETITGENYESHVKRAVLAPAGITDMQIGGNTLEERKRNEVKYYGQHKEDPYRYNIARMDAHGGWIASATDLLKIVNHIDGATSVKDILAPASVRTMLTAPTVSPGYACGWGIDSLGNFQHGGSLPGTRTELRHRTNGYAYAVLLNTRAWDTAFTAGFTRLMQTIQEVEIPIPSVADQNGSSEAKPGAAQTSPATLTAAIDNIAYGGNGSAIPATAATAAIDATDKAQAIPLTHSTGILNSATAATAAADTFRPAFFVDTARWTKMEAAFPIIEKMYRQAAEQNNIPGIAFGIVGNGRLLYAGGTGYSNLDKKIKVSPSSVYRIASMTKSFTAMAILMLRDAGKLNLDDPVSRFIPEMKNTPPLSSDSRQITIRDLLSHTAGFPEDNPWADRQLQRTDEELIRFMAKGVSLSTPPGTGYEYSNLGFALLGNIVTKASGSHYIDFINQHIFQPLGMQHTYWEYTDVPADLLTHGYRRVNGEWREEEMLHSGAYGAMGGLLTSIEDFSRYMNLHLAAWPASSQPDNGILKRSSLREMHTPGNISGFFPAATTAAGEPCPRVNSYNFGLGWSKDCEGKEQITHSGGLPGFGTHWAILPAYGIGIVSFSNLTYAANSALNSRLLDTLIALAGLQPRQIAPSAILRQRKDELVKLLPDWRKAPASGIFSENFFSDYFVDSLRKEAISLFNRAGRILLIGEMIPDNQLRGRFEIEGEKATLQIRFTLSPENPALIQQYSIRELPKASTGATGKYGLTPIASPEAYRALVAKDPRQELVDLEKHIPGIVLDVRYATSDNLMKRPVYATAAAFMRRPAADALKSIQQELNKKGYGLKIYDGYRPYDVTVIFYEQFHDTTFVASPYTGSRHNRGCAVDLTLIDLKTGKELAMPTAYDSFTPRAHSAFASLPAPIRKNRVLLQEVMLKHGFVIYPDEWWHFDFGGWQQYPILNIPFEMLKAR